MSNPDLSGPYWQDQGDAGYGSARRASAEPSRQQSAWDDGGGFWRDDRSAGRAGRDNREPRGQGDRYRDSQVPARGSRRPAAGGAPGASDGSWANMLAGRSRREPQPDDNWGSHRGSGRSAGRARRSPDSDRGDWTGRLSQTAGDLRSKFGNMRTRAAASLGGDRGQAAWRGAEEGDYGRGAAAGNGAGGNGSFNSARGTGRRGVARAANNDDWAEQGGRRGGSAAWGSRSSGEAGPGRAARRAAHAGGYGAGHYGAGDYGPGDYGPGDYDSRTAAGRTALREPAGDFWNEPDGTSRGQRSRLAERQFTRGGGNGRGGGGHGGGRSYRGPGGRGGGFKNWLLYGSWWRHWTLKKALAVVGAGIAACFLLGIAGFFILYEMTPIPTAAGQTANWQSSSVYFADGKQMGVFDGGGIERMLLTQAQIPGLMTHAMTAAEDRHFYTEGGVSLTGLMRAAFEDIKGNGNLQGGSTITMQYAKNYYAGVNNGQNLSTKLKEIFIAMKLGHKESKQWVMTNYLNTVPFGATIDGLGAAAQSYFSVNLTKPGAKLTLAQAALLAAMPNNPAVFSSVVLSSHPSQAPGYSALLGRFNYVLGNMVRDGTISAATAKATTFPKITPPPAGNGETGVTGYLMNMVEQQLEAPFADGGYNLTRQQIDTRGYKIRTTFNMAKINALARSVRFEKGQMKSLGVPFPRYDRIGAALENSKTGAIVAIYGGPGYLSNQKRCNASSCYINMAESAQPVGSSFKPYVLSAAVNLGMSVFTSKLNGFAPIWIPLHTPGGGTTTQLTPSRLTPPPGCSRTATNCFSSDGNTYFKFDEATENSGKPLPVNVAAAISSDPAFEDLAHRDGIDNVISMAQQFGVGQDAFVAPCGATTGGTTMAETIKLCNDLTGPSYVVGKSRYQGHGLEINFSPNTNDKYARNSAGTPGSPAIALGENPLTPIEQATMVATLADDGVYHTPHVIQSVQLTGTTLASHLTTRTVLSPAAAADVDYALSFDNNYGQGTAEATVPFRRGDVIGKTGTLGVSNTASQAWFVGATPDGYAMSVALFTNDPGIQTLNNLPTALGTPGSQGGAWPASIWNEFFTSEFSNAPVIQLFPQVQPGFQPWIQVHAAPKPKKQFCQQGFGGGNQGGGNQGCVCPKHSPFCGNNPNPQPSCNGNGHGGNCGTSPNPTPSCQTGVFGGQCSSSPAPSTTPTTPTPSCSPGVPPGQCQTTALTSYVRSSAGSGSSPGSAASIVVLAAEDATTRLAALLGLVI